MDFLSHGLLNFSYWGVVITTLVLTHISIASITIFLHRHQAHSSLSLHPVASHFFRLWLWLTTGAITKEWVAVHRKHHAGCETEHDPHSPQVKGFRNVLLRGYELYRQEARNQETLTKYGHGTPDDWLERNLYSRYSFLGVSIMLFADIALFGLIGITVFAVQMLWMPLLAAGVINGVGHYSGYRNFESEDASRNILPWGILIGGEELHNNHHAYASSAKLSNKWWEVDIGWWYIRLLSFVGLARVKKIAPKLQSIIGKQIVDIETVRAVVRHRYLVMKVYGRRVILPVLREERSKADAYCKQLFNRAKGLIIREDIKLKNTDQQIIAEALQRSKSLETVYQFKQKLKGVWARSSQSEGKQRLVELQNWCAEAEQTGIQVLQEFSLYLRGYHLQQV